MSEGSRAAYIWISILGFILWLVGVALTYVPDWARTGDNLTSLGFAILLFSIALLLYSKP